LFYTDDFSGSRHESQTAKDAAGRPGKAKRDNRSLLVGQVYPSSILGMNKQLAAGAECLGIKNTRNAEAC
jgi:hypothetical protein